MTVIVNDVKGRAGTDDAAGAGGSARKIERRHHLASAAVLLLAGLLVAALAMAAGMARHDQELADHLWWIVLVGGAIAVGSTAALQRQLDRSRHGLLQLAKVKEEESAQQRGNAEALQRALLPKDLQVPPGCQLASRYWPAEADTLVGGDFYDAFRIDRYRWGLVIGDVCGHGIEAAAMTGLVRNSLRSAARYSYSPADMLRSVHVAVAEHDPAMFCTACLIIMMPDRSGGAELICALGGHPHPLLRRREGEVLELGQPGTLLGQLEPELIVTSTVARPGDTLMLYTDGLTDLPGDHAVPLDEIRNELDNGNDRRPAELAEAIHGLKRKRNPAGSRDDTALLVVRFGSP